MIRRIILFALILILGYLIGSFVMADFDITEWTIDAREAVAGSSITISIIVLWADWIFNG